MDLPRNGTAQPVTDLIDTTEMYLRTIYELIEDGVPPLRARIAEQLGHSGPTVSQTIARMERDGLVIVDIDRTLRLTAAGEETAVRVMRKHRLAERLLTDIIGLELPHVHDEACRWEHVMSERVEKRVLELLGEPAVSPYGNHIPGLEELGIEPASAGQQPSHELSVLEAMESDVTSATLVRIGENPQTLADFLAIAVEIGLLPGASVTLERHDERISISTDRGTVEIPGDAARHLFVVQGSK
jgi:DtxR family Mn-dependent transcriptional regulator